MSSQPPDPSSRKGGGLWARLFGVKPEDENEETPAQPPTPPAQASAEPPAEPPVARRVEPLPPPEPVFAPSTPAIPALELGAAVASRNVAEEVAEAVLATDTGPTPEETALAAKVADVLEFTAPPAEAPPLSDEPEPIMALAVEPPPVFAPPKAQACPICATPRQGESVYCADCGYMYSGDSSPAGSAEPVASGEAGGAVLKNRYHVSALLSERFGVKRYRALDLGDGSGEPRAVILVTAPLPAAAEPAPADSEEDIVPTFDDAMSTTIVSVTWPGVSWEQAVVEQAQTPFLPQALDYFVEGGSEYLALEIPQARSLWDAWLDAEDAKARYGLLTSLAKGLHALHQGGAVCEGLHPDALVVDDSGQVRLTELGVLLPLPMPVDAAVRINLYTAPELVLDPGKADARVDMYSFGAILYSLEYLGHALEEKDFEKQFSPRLITERYPDVHPGFNRLILKTFTRDLGARFPTDEIGKKDPGGFTELIRTLEVAGRTYDQPRLDVAAWTTTGMVRTGNEDAFSLLHAVDARQDDLSEYVLILLADGMGGYDCGEVAAALALDALRKFLLDQPLFGGLTGKPTPPGPFNVESCKQVLDQALRYANKEVFTFSRTPGKGKRGMGCTAEAVYIDNRNIVVGHVGDSRTYHIHKGRLIQMTRDQTLVQRLVELGQLSAEEAETHDRKNELQQAVGGQPDVRPGVYHGVLQRNDWVLVCSDGLTNHINNRELEQMMTREAAGSAEEAARRFMNLVNLRGATDNTTVVAVRAS